MNRLENNLKYIESVDANLHGVLSAVKETRYSTVPSRKGGLTMVYRQGAETFYLHSKFKPEEEALKLVQKINPEANHIVVLGLGAGYHLQFLMAAKPPKTRVLLVEPDIEIFWHSLKTIDWSVILGRKDFFFSIGIDMNMLSGAIQSFLDVASFSKLETLELPSEARFHAGIFSTIKETIDNEIRTQLLDFKSRLAEDSMVPRNILKNIPGILKTRPVKPLENAFTGLPGFIVSAGPSLDKNILYLKKINHRAVIICVDTALKPLLKRGIHPHFTMVADPSYRNYLHLQGTETDIRYFLVADAGISTRVYDDFHPHMFTVSLGKPIIRMIEENIGEIGEVDAWGSVISLALSFAVYIGLEPIVFLGQDFAYTDMRNHCRGTSWEDSWTENTSDTGQMQRKEKNSISGIAKMSEVKDIYGQDTVSSDRLLLYKNYLVKMLGQYRGKRFINATEGGVLQEIENMPLYRVLKEVVFPGKPVDLQDLFGVPTLDSPQTRKKLLTFFKAKMSFFRKYGNKLDKMIQRLETASSSPLGSLPTLLEEAENLKDFLYQSNLQNGELIEMWSQGPIYNYLKKSAPLHGQAITQANRGEFTGVFLDYFNKLQPLVNNAADSFGASAKELQKET